LCAALQLYWAQNDIPIYHQAIVKLCQMHLKAQNIDGHGRLLRIPELRGERMATSTWLELCRAAEGQLNFEVPWRNTDKLARAYPTERQSLLR